MLRWAVIFFVVAISKEVLLSKEEDPEK